MATPAHEFVSQAREHLTVLEQSLLALERPGGAAERREAVDRCLRGVHSIKGDAGFLGFTTVRVLADAIETVLEALRDRDTPAPAAVIEPVLAARDRLASLIDDLPDSGGADLTDLLASLAAAARGLTDSVVRWDLDLRAVDRLHAGRLAGVCATLAGFGPMAGAELSLGPVDLTQSLPSGPIRLSASQLTTTPQAEIARALGLAAGPGPGAAATHRWPLRIALADWVGARGQSLGGLLAELATLGTLEGAALEGGPPDLAAGPGPWPLVLRGTLRTRLSEAELGVRLGLPPAEAPTPVPVPVPAEQSAARDVPAPAPAPAPVSVATGSAAEPERPASLRINVDLLDRLMTLASELTLIRNQSLLAFNPDDDRTRPIVQRLDAVTSALQETVLRTRMQPVGNLFGKFPRLVRDLGRQLGKQVELAIVGREVELDKTILEQLSDPLTHLIRNSVDHGLEGPAERAARGKPETGRITLSASHDEGQIRIEIRDDGRGIDADAVRAKALATRLRTEAELDRMSPRELFGLILLPGFSTARSVSEVSGRGVGMDVVKTNIELLEGSLTIDSAPGLGTAMILRLPLTLAIVPCLVIAAEGQRYAIPVRDLEETVCLHPQLPGRIERAHDTELYRLRDRLLPVVRFREVLARRAPFTTADRAAIVAAADAAADPDRVAFILVLKTAGRRFGLVVDAVCGIEEIVVKPIHPALKRVEIFSGATIMGDGRVALIADVAGIFSHARPPFAPEPVPVTAGPDAGAPVQPQRVLLFESGPHEQFALPLVQIRRVEMIEPGQIERLGDREFVTVDDVSHRVLRLESVLDVSAPGPIAAGSPVRLPLILPKSGSEPVAILASRIVDTESLAVALQPRPECGPGVLGSALVRDRLTLFLDLHALGRGRASLAATPGAAVPTRQAPRVLLVEDTPFFLEVVRRYLVGEGFAVTTAGQGAEGLERLADSGPFDLIVSDIEMPVLDGWEFARAVRRLGITTPMLALTSLNGPAHERKARECGFDGFEVKLDHDRLVRAIAGLLADRGVMS